MPFVFIAFLQALALEVLYFSPRHPVSLIFAPIIKRFFGENFLHYPGNLLIMPSLYYYADVLIYIIVSVALAAISINIFRNAQSKTPITTAALIRNALKRYVSFVIFGIIVILLSIFIERADKFVYFKIMRLAAKQIPNVVAKFSGIGLTLFLYLSNIILQIFLILTIPLMVIQKRPLFIALGRSVYLGVRNFFRIFTLLFLPYLLYLPVVLLRSGTVLFMEKTVPEITLVIIGIGIIATVFIDCFMIICASQFLWDIEREKAA